MANLQEEMANLQEETANLQEETANLMIHPIPPGTRDILPDEMRELRRLHRAMIDVFESHGYGEVATPAIEYDEVLARGDGRTAKAPTASSTSAATCWRCAPT